MFGKKERLPYQATCSQHLVYSSSVPRDSVLAFELTTGREVWNKTTPRKAFYALIYNQETDEVVAEESIRPWDLYRVDPATGSLIYSYEKVVDAPDDDALVRRGPMYLIDMGQLFIGGTVLDVQIGTVIHKDERFTNYPPTVTSDTMYLSAYKEGIVAYDRTDYEVRWIYQPQTLTPLSPITILDGIGYVIFSDATLRAFDLETGQELGYWQPNANDLWYWPICYFPPILCDKSARAGLAASSDTLFVSFGDGKLHAFGK